MLRQSSPSHGTIISLSSLSMVSTSELSVTSPVNGFSIYTDPPVIFPDVGVEKVLVLVIEITSGRSLKDFNGIGVNGFVELFASV